MLMNRRKFLGGLMSTSAAVAGCASPPADSRTPSSRPSEVDWPAFQDYLGQRAVAGLFSGAVRVERDGRVLVDQALGEADRAGGVPNTPNTKFCVCSMGKMFTAVAVAQLVSARRVAFDTTIGRYVPGFPSAIADHVTVAELLTHTSGMGDVLQRTGPAQPPETLADQLAQIAKTPLLFPPGSSSSYSNSGFIVLGALVQNLSGSLYDDYLHEHVFGPAGMVDTDVRVYQPADVAGMAHGHMLVDAQGHPITTPPAPGQNPIPAGASFQDNGNDVQIGNPSGGAISTTQDMARFARALMWYELLDASLTAMVTAGKVPVNRPGGPAWDRYAYGFEDERIGGVRIVGHNGGSPGYEGQLDIYPDLGYSVVILTNQDRALVPAIRQTESLLTGTGPTPATRSTPMS
jgi:CubicO group peptidase (beta-lactamase class C family)